MTESASSEEFIVTRRQELLSRANERGIDTQRLFKNLPQDNDTLIAIALASRLGFNFPDALNPNKTLDELERDRELRAKEEEQAERFRLETESRHLLGR